MEACIPAYALPLSLRLFPPIRYQNRFPSRPKERSERLLATNRWSTATSPRPTTAASEPTASFAIQRTTTTRSALGPFAALLASLDENTHLTGLSSDVDPHTTLATLVLGQRHDDRLLGSFQRQELEESARL